MPSPRADDGAATTPDPTVRFFLIADVRGYTSFTQLHGDEAGARLAARFAACTREVVTSWHGVLLELAGDGALVVFTSARQTVRAALALQLRFRDETLTDPGLPLPVGIGIDAGEAVAVEGGFRGGALNLASRLCSQARAGEVLASQEVVHLARHIDGVRYLPRGRVALKGFGEPVPVIEVLPSEPDLERQAAFRATVAGRPPQRRPRRLVLLAGAVGVVVLAAAGTFAARRSDPSPIVLAQGDRVDVVGLDRGQVVDQVRLTDRPAAIAAGARSLWVASAGAGTIARLDPHSHSLVDSIDVGGRPGGIVVDGGLVWVTDQGGRTVSEISPDVGEVVHTVTVGNGPTGIAAGPSGIWVTNRSDGTVTLIDPGTGTVRDTVDVGAGPIGVAVSADTVWVTNSEDGTVSAIDARTHSPRATYPVGAGPSGITLSTGAVWVANTAEGTLARLDPVTGSVRQIPVGNGPAGVVAAGGGVWVSDSYGASIVHVDARRLRIDREVRVGGTPVGLAVARGQMWATAAAAPVVHRGGRLRVAAQSNFFPSSMDPVMAGTIREPQMVFDGLVGLNRLTGVGGAALVPDLAVALPTPVDSGRTYSFRVRTGIRYSNGMRVRASDFRRTFERMFTVRGAPFADYFTAVRGARSCRAKPATCDLSRGIQTDEATGTVTIHLKRADPDFLYKLALPVAAAVPPGTPLHHVATGAVPGTGPYRIATFVPGPQTGVPGPPVPHQAAPDVTGPTDAVLDLRRNPHFQEWSRPAQPDGYPDRIVLRLNDVSHPDRALNDVLAGTTSLALNFGVFPGRMAELHQRHAGQVHVEPFFLIYLGLDTTRPPFSDVRARQALTLAVDQRRIRQLFGERGSILATCQILPPGFPGYSRHCPYPPDLAKARRLFARSETATGGVTVTLALPSGDQARRVGGYIAGVLRSLGYGTRLRLLDDYFGERGRLHPAPQVVWSAFGPDYPAPSNYLLSLVGCEAAHQKEYTYNVSRFCDKRVVQPTIHQALASQQTEPAAAVRLWKQADRAAADEAAILPWGYLTEVVVTARGVGGYTAQPPYGVLYDQLWVR